MAAPLQAEKIFNIGPIPVTNSFITATIVTIIIVIVALMYNKKANLIPTKFTGLIESFVEFLHTTIESIAGKKTHVFFPLGATFFIFIIINSYFGLLPIVGPIGVHQIVDGKDELVPILRSINADINGTIVLALVSVVMTHFFAIRSVGVFAHIARYLPFLNIRLRHINTPKKFATKLAWSFIDLFVGLLELISEFVKIISLSFRLFGNIFAGEIVLSTISSLLLFSAFILPIPFIALEIIVGYVQATVFTLLTVVFMTILSERHGAEEEHEESEVISEV